MEKILFSSLEKIFIEKRIYRDIEECETFELVISTTDKGLKPYKKQFYREIFGLPVSGPSFARSNVCTPRPWNRRSSCTSTPAANN